LINTFFIIWFVVNLLLLAYVLQEYILVFYAFKGRRKQIVGYFDYKEKVTIQLPLYNEKYVVQRLLDAVTKIDYPKELLEIQVLDDSTDETTSIIEQFIQEHPEKADIIRHVRRPDRKGFKAGALQFGLEVANGDFIAIFDADFVPDPSFLKKALPQFGKKIGVVQTRWSFINENYSLITRAQAIMLNTHFSIEQLGRSNAKGFINFNGTAGVWRKECILDSGGWQADTLTEDLDLSFRAQAKGWKFRYLFDVKSPSELPVTFDAFRTQQFRWSKGAAECFRKNIKKLWRSSSNLGSKLMGTFHLLNSSVYLLTLLIMIMGPVIYFFQSKKMIDIEGLEIMLSIGLIVFALLLVLFFIGTIFCASKPIKSILYYTPSILVFFAMTMGISAFMVFGVIEGYLGRRSEFVRTPKFGAMNEIFQKVKSGYDYKKERSLALLEFIFLLFGLFWGYVGVKDLNPIVIIYSCIITGGFSLSLFFKNTTFRSKAI
tara:strand:+ start:182203 stop:183666 length:1464 start_codon:yes stop_codon:yes gene_type:complete